MNDEMFRLSLIDLMNNDLLNDFVNMIFKYRLKENEYIYMQYKIANGNIILNIFDNNKKNRFKAYIFSNDSLIDENNNILYLNVEDCYLKYKNKKTNNKLYLLGALLKTTNTIEKKEIINNLFENDIKGIFIKHFI